MYSQADYRMLPLVVKGKSLDKINWILYDTRFMIMLKLVHQFIDDLT